MSAAADWPKDDADRIRRALAVEGCHLGIRIMRLLSPVADMPSPGEAAEWRARVAAVKTKRALRRTPGDVIRLPCPVKVRSVSTDRLTMIEYRKRTPIFAPVTHPALLCRLRAATLAGATVER